MDLLLPSTYGADERDMRIKAVKYGMAARAASIHGIDRIIIYKDPDDRIDEERNGDLLQKHLEYAECPPYLRKELIPYDEDLQYANILPALQIISHGYSDRFREAVVTDVDEGELELKAGMERPLKAYGEQEEGERVTVQILEDDQARIIDREAIDGFWTFEIDRRDQELGEVINELDKPVLATAFEGDPVNEHRDEIASPDDLAVVFGSAWRGIPAMAERGDLERGQLDMELNFVPGQETKTVRTEEALYTCLGILNVIRER